MVDDVPAALAEKLSWLMESWSSIELRVRFDVTNRSGTRGQSLETYIETASGQRLYDRTSPSSEALDTNRWANYTDGRVFAEATWAGPRQENVLYSKAFGTEGFVPCSSRPAPLQFLYLDQQPLARALPKAEPLGQERRLGRDCEILVLKGVKWTFSPVEIVYALDRETALPLEVRCYDAGADRARDQPQWSWEARSFDRVGDGRYWPMRSADFVYGPAEGRGKKLLASREVLVESIQFDKEYPATIFRPALEPGTPVLDTITHKSWVVPGQRATMTQDPASAPLQATRPPDWTATASSAGLVLGVALLVAGVAVWWKRHRG